MSQPKVYDLRNILNALPDEHKLFINGRAIEKIEINMTQEIVNITLRGEKSDDNRNRQIFKEA